MKRAAVVLALLLAGCGFRVHEDPVRPEVFINLSVAPQVCANQRLKTPEGEVWTREVYAFVTRRGTAPGPIRVTIDERVVSDLYGETVTAHYLHVGVGPHTIRAEADGLVAERSFTVYYCEGMGR